MTMLWTIAMLLLILWLLGMVTSYTLGGFIHILLVIAVIIVIIRIIRGRNPLLTFSNPPRIVWHNHSRRLGVLVCLRFLLLPLWWPPWQLGSRIPTGCSPSRWMTA